MPGPASCTRAPRQVVEEGYEFFAKRQLVTIFSAPNYCGEFENAGAMMSVDETLMCSFQVCAALLGVGGCLGAWRWHRQPLCSLGIVDEHQSFICQALVHLRLTRP